MGETRRKPREGLKRAAPRRVRKSFASCTSPRGMSRAWPSGRKAGIAAGYEVSGGGGVVLFDARGQRLHNSPLPVKEGAVTSVAFGPDGAVAAGFGHSAGNGGGVVLFDAKGKRLRSSPLPVKENAVTSVAFGPDGRGRRRVLSTRPADGGRVVLFDAEGPAAAQLAAAGQGGRCHERGLRAGRPDGGGVRRLWRRRRGGPLRRQGPAAPCPVAASRRGWV